MSSNKRRLAALVILAIASLMGSCLYNYIDSTSYIVIDNVKVARSMKIKSKNQLESRIKLGYIDVVFNEKAEIVVVRPLPSIENAGPQGSCSVYYRWICG